jgi:MoaA/NifB/PqqE/SkfB family radical SAM enzyme
MFISKILKKRVPIIGNILILNRCNLKCFYCYPNVFNRQITDMSLDDFKKIVDILKKHGTKIVILLGGEPLLRKDLEQFVDYVIGKGMFCEVVTNGYFVKERLAALKKADSVCISIDGDEEANDKNRGKGCFKKAMEAINICRENNIHFRIKAVITRNNLNSLDFLGKLARDKGAVLMAITPTLYDDREYSAEAKKLWIDKNEYHRVIQKLIQLKKEGCPIFHSYTALNYCLQWPYEFHEIVYEDQLTRDNRLSNGQKIIPCSALQYQVFVDVDGTFFITCIKTFNIKAKSILEMDFDEWWIPQERFNCKTCALLPNLDKSLTYNMNPEALVNMVRVALYDKKQRG